MGKLITKIIDLPNDDFYVYNICLDRSKCHRMRIIDTGNNGICCENGNGFYELYWGGDKLYHNEFDKDSGSKQELLFGECKEHVPGSAPLLQPSSRLSLQPSSQPSHLCEKYSCEECTLACDHVTYHADLSPAFKEEMCDVINCCQWEDSKCKPIAECGCSS